MLPCAAPDRTSRRLEKDFNLLEGAAFFALHYIDAVLGPQKEEFAVQVCIVLYVLFTDQMTAATLQTTLHVSSPSVWLPYSSLDHLGVTLQKTESPSLLQVFTLVV